MADFAVDIDFWVFEIGVNAIPADTRNKRTYEEWSQWQDQPVAGETFEEWKRQRKFEKGCAVITGKIWRGKYKGKYLCAIDLDNKEGIKELLSHFGDGYTIEMLAEKTIVEWHPDNPNKIHVYYIVEKPLSKKSGIGIFFDNNTNKEDIPAIEVKSEGKHGIMYCSSSPHKDGYNYEIIGTRVPAVLNAEQSIELEYRINRIYAKYTSKPESENLKVSIENLFKPDFEIYKDHNRSETLMRIMESLIQRLKGIYTEEKIKELSQEWNQKHCKPPLDTDKFEYQWKCAKGFLGDKKEDIIPSNRDNDDKDEKRQSQKQNSLHTSIH
ncbi:MAG: bifunctional DNA primase/polymerase [Candidatus Nitrosocosmicus sp.]|nr:bifunctional DNA primase/polymerase [Candidatus Nitrosocosmicus sp.]MDN5867951.1 bifunctional DNA primase/polymerase [Candidatus Nitrosocosmicus sp.]